VLEAGELAAVDIGVVTPYVGQVRVLRRAVREMLPPGLLENVRDLDVQSVDGFQGREKELIIFSAVRSNDRRSLGFLKDWRRLNVMVTRARRGLIVVCDTSTLQHDQNWAAWIKWAEKEGFEASFEGGSRVRLQKSGLRDAAPEEGSRVRLQKSGLRDAEPALRAVRQLELAFGEAA